MSLLFYTSLQSLLQGGESRPESQDRYKINVLMNGRHKNLTSTLQLYVKALNEIFQMFVMWNSVMAFSLTCSHFFYVTSKTAIQIEQVGLMTNNFGLGYVALQSHLDDYEFIAVGNKEWNKHVFHQHRGCRCRVPGQWDPQAHVWEKNRRKKKASAFMVTLISYRRMSPLSPWISELLYVYVRVCHENHGPCNIRNQL